MQVDHRKKIFCIGSGKTGTTSIGAALCSLGFRLGDQAQGELLIEDWARRDFRPIVEYCKTAEQAGRFVFGCPVQYDTQGPVPLTPR